MRKKKGFGVLKKPVIKKKKFLFLEHTADMKFQAFGKTVEKVFINSASALKDAMAKGIKVAEIKKKIINIKRKDSEALLYAFLEEILYLLDAENFLTIRVSKIKIEKNTLKANQRFPFKQNEFNLKATVIGDDASNYEFTNSVKAVTYNEMFVKKTENGSWVAQVVLDV
ncbi:archease [Candidatus Pacearchaeota archaeon]|jgi:SHS2 domain-containing protein|nr:archease [Candidatus Pacearchaeota archaeon]